jgi:hypothetical protein
MTRLVLQDASLLDGDTAARRAILKGGGLEKDNLEKRYGLR